MTELIYLDTETTGLNPDIHEVWEIAYAINDGPVVSFVLPHSLRTADPQALELNGYFERRDRIHPSTMAGNNDLQIRRIIEGNTLVCANPPFDRGFLRKRWGVEPWHYRSIDVESVALAVLGYDRPKGLKDIAKNLRVLGYDIPEPDHSAGKDVEVLRACYKVLRSSRDL